nr:hypothetical protein [Tanacetum cinerariifolium]
MNFRTLITSAGNEVEVVVLLESIRAISERFADTVYDFFWGKKVAYPVVANYVKLYGVPVTAFREDGLSAIATKLGFPDRFLVLLELNDRSYSGLLILLLLSVLLLHLLLNLIQVWNEVFLVKKGVNEKGRGVKENQQGNGGAHSLGNGGTLNSSDATNTQINENISGLTANVAAEIDNIEKLIIDGKVTLVNDEGKLLKNVDYSGDHDSDDEVESVGEEFDRLRKPRVKPQPSTSRFLHWINNLQYSQKQSVGLFDMKFELMKQRKDTKVPQPSNPTATEVDEAIHKDKGDRLVSATTTVASLDAKQDSVLGLCAEEKCSRGRTVTSPNGQKEADNHRDDN